MTSAYERLAERIAQAIENKGNSAQVHARLEELQANARRGLAIQERFAPRSAQRKKLVPTSRRG